MINKKIVPRAVKSELRCI